MNTNNFHLNEVLNMSNFQHLAARFVKSIFFVHVFFCFPLTAHLVFVVLTRFLHNSFMSGYEFSFDS